MALKDFNFETGLKVFFFGTGMERGEEKEGKSIYQV
jgi:hypothetical protein